MLSFRRLSVDDFYRRELIFYLSIYLTIYLSIYLSIYPSIHPSIHPSIYLSIYLSIYESEKHTKFIKTTNISLLFRRLQCVIKLQTKIQITQQHNKKHLQIKNTYRTREIIVKGKM